MGSSDGRVSEHVVVGAPGMFYGPVAPRLEDLPGWAEFVRKQPAHGGRYACPVDGCSWNMDVPAPTTGARQAPSGGITFTSTGVDPGQLDVAFLSHAEGHSAVEFLVTIRRLNGELAEATQHAEADAS